MNRRIVCRPRRPDTRTREEKEEDERQRRAAARLKEIFEASRRTVGIKMVGLDKIIESKSDDNLLLDVCRMSTNKPTLLKMAAAEVLKCLNLYHCRIEAFSQVFRGSKPDTLFMEFSKDTKMGNIYKNVKNLYGHAEIINLVPQEAAKRHEAIEELAKTLRMCSERWQTKIRLNEKGFVLYKRARSSKNWISHQLPDDGHYGKGFPAVEGILEIMDDRECSEVEDVAGRKRELSGDDQQRSSKVAKLESGVEGLRGNIEEEKNTV
eukprot:GFUD01083266.1.p1 GENE.GFUD01083266.1~~GFUD01083266.1.p1  ORF type:complete len:280 (-),score=73.54 GFUD01083266.1:107-901(-)